MWGGGGEKNERLRERAVVGRKYGRGGGVKPEEQRERMLQKRKG